MIYDLRLEGVALTIRMSRRIRYSCRYSYPPFPDGGLSNFGDDPHRFYDLQLTTRSPKFYPLGNEQCDTERSSSRNKLSANHNTTAPGCIPQSSLCRFYRSRKHRFLISLRYDCGDQVSRGGLNPTIRVRKIAQSRSRHALELQSVLINKSLQTRMADE